MGELCNLWLYQEDTYDLNMKLQNTRLELEAVRIEVNIAKQQTREKEKQLNDILQMVYKERDEAREQLHNLLNMTNPFPNLSTLQPNPNMIDSNQYNNQKQPGANSSITESNTLSDTYNNNLNNSHSYVSSPVDSIFDAVTSPEFTTFNSMGGDSCNNKVELDHATMVIDGLIQGKVLPQKGKLLDAVMESGPLLQTLMLAGPLPRWRNPPPPQHFNIPQMATISTPHLDYHYHPIVADPMRPSWTPSMSCGSTSHLETNNISLLNFSNGGVSSGRLLMNMNNQTAVGKRQRLMQG